MWVFGGFGGYDYGYGGLHGGLYEEAAPWGSAAISERAEGKLNEAKALFDNHIALVDVTQGPVRDTGWRVAPGAQAAPASGRVRASLVCMRCRCGCWRRVAAVGGCWPPSVERRLLTSLCPHLPLPSCPSLFRPRTRSSTFTW